MTRFALLAHSDLDAIVARRHGEAISVRHFLADVHALAAVLPDTEHVINACADRYRFAVGFAACLISGRVSLLPPSHATKTFEQLADFAADAVVLADTPYRDLPLSVVPFPRLPTVGRGAGSTIREIPSIDADQLAAWVFTSGSTGVPRPHAKHWGLLTRNVTNEALALGLAEGPPATLVGTVPPQHMYGFESTVLLAWQSGGAFEAGRPFYPADIVATLAATPAPAVLITTPFHLNAILESRLDPPSIALLVCATAPLSAQLAERAEAAFHAPLLEIYGSTETGQLATRRTRVDAAWTLFPGVRFEERSGQTWADGGHIDVPVPLGDVIAPLDGCRFLLQGRQTDLINIAGKRTSLGWLNRQLLAIEGVRDGEFYLPRNAGDGQDGTIARLAAFVVAPSHGRAQLLNALRERIDPVFLPRPLVFVDALPRNAVGKLPRDACETLLTRHASRSCKRP